MGNKMTETWKCSNCEADGAWKRWNGDRLEISCTDCRVEGSEPLDPEYPEIIGEDAKELKRVRFSRLRAFWLAFLAGCSMWFYFYR